MAKHRLASEYIVDGSGDQRHILDRYSMFILHCVISWMGQGIKVDPFPLIEGHDGVEGGGRFAYGTGGSSIWTGSSI